MPRTKCGSSSSLYRAVASLNHPSGAFLNAGDTRVCGRIAIYDDTLVLIGKLYTEREKNTNGSETATSFEDMILGKPERRS